MNEKYGTCLLTTSSTYLKAILEVGTIGSIRLSNAAVRSMLANHHGGVIVNISPTLAISGHFEGAPYTMTKATIVTLTKYIVREHGRRNIQAYTLILGNITTEATYKFMTEEERLRGAQEAAMKRWGEQDEVAKVAACVAGENFSFATGNIITADERVVMS